MAAVHLTVRRTARAQLPFTVRALLRLLKFACTPYLAKISIYQGTIGCQKKWKALKGCRESG